MFLHLELKLIPTFKSHNNTILHSLDCNIIRVIIRIRYNTLPGKQMANSFPLSGQ